MVWHALHRDGVRSHGPPCLLPQDEAEALFGEPMVYQLHQKAQELVRNLPQAALSEFFVWCKTCAGRLKAKNMHQYPQAAEQLKFDSMHADDRKFKCMQCGSQVSPPPPWPMDDVTPFFLRDGRSVPQQPLPSPPQPLSARFVTARFRLQSFVQSPVAALATRRA